MSIEDEIQLMIDVETDAWNRKDANALVDLFHPDMVWPWPPDAESHDPVKWVFPLGRYNRDRWKRGWEELFDEYELVHNNRTTVKILLSEEKDGAFAVVDVDTLWRHRKTQDPFHWKGRAGKGYTKVEHKWLLIYHTGLLIYDEIETK
jgi:ketosteroid isomerase-like protein